jgi:uncharacterized protein YndB with AHSA1/START domain
MVAIEKSVLVKAPPEEVYAYLDDPLHLPEVWPSMVEVRDVADLPNGGHRFHWVYKMAGARFEGDSETVEIEPGRHYVQQNTGQIPSSFDWTFVAENGSTRLMMKSEYEIPETLLGKLARPFIVRLNEREAETVLANVKDRIEA